MITEDQREIIIDILTNTESLDKISLELDNVSKTFAIKYEHLDSEWFKELQASSVI